MGSVAPQPDDVGLTEGRGTWVLPIGDGKITQIRIDYAFTLVLESWIEIRIEMPFTYGPEGGLRRFEPSDAPGPGTTARASPGNRHFGGDPEGRQAHAGLR